MPERSFIHNGAKSMPSFRALKDRIMDFFEQDMN
jgi:hypothetical protein